MLQAVDEAVKLLFVVRVVLQCILKESGCFLFAVHQAFVTIVMVVVAALMGMALGMVVLVVVVTVFPVAVSLMASSPAIRGRKTKS